MKQYLRAGQSGGQETFSLIFIIMVGTAVFENRLAFHNLPGNSIWVSVLLGAALALFTFWMTVKLLQRGNGDLIDGIQDAMGKKIGTVMIILIMMGILLNTQRIIGLMGVLIYWDIIPDMPIELTIFFIALGILPLAFMGLECIARISKFFIVPVFIILIAMLAMDMSNVEIYKLAPFLENGIGSSIFGGISLLRVFYNAVCLGFVAGALNAKGYPSTFKKATFTSIAAIVIVFFVTSASFTPSMKEQNYLPIFNVVTSYQNAGMLFRAEAGIIFLWILSALVNGAIGVYLCAYIIGRLAGAEDIRPITVGTWTLTYFLALLPYRPNALYRGYIDLIQFWLFILLLLPISITFIVHLLRKKKGKKLCVKNLD